MNFWHRFVGFRKDYAALAYDACRAAREGSFSASSRLCAVFAFGLLLLVPGTVLILGEAAFGDKLAFGIAFGLWPILLEAPGWWLRREDAARLTNRPAPPGSPGFDSPAFLVMSGVGIAIETIVAYVIVGSGDEVSETWRGVLWGIGLAGGIDLARTAIALFLAGAQGFPLYR